MTRTQGAKNKPKTVKQLIELAEKELAKEGKKLTIIDANGKPSIASELEVPNIFELQPNEDIDTYKCGNCQKELDQPFAICPHCGAKLQW